MKERLRRAFTLLTVIALVILLLPARWLPSAAEAQPAVQPSATLPAVTAALRSAPVMFIENVGQFDPGARFQVMGADSALFLADDALWFSVLEKPSPTPSPPANPSSTTSLGGPVQFGKEIQGQDKPRTGVNLRVSFVGANPRPRLEPFNRLEANVSYFIGNDPVKWHADVPVWGGVRYVDLYPGIDLEVTSENGQMVQKMVAKTSGDLNSIRLRVDGADGMALGRDTLTLKTKVGEFSFPLLTATTAEGSPALNGGSFPDVNGNTVSQPFSSPPRGAVNQVVNPSPDLIYSTFLGGSDDDEANAVATDPSGATYIAGMTASTNFPTTVGAYDRSYNGGPWDAFVAKLDPPGKSLSYATFLGGSGMDNAFGIAVSATGAAFITGYTASANFPTTSGAFDQAYNGGAGDAFVTKLSPTGNGLTYSTFFGGSANDTATAVDIDASGAAYVVGYTDSNNFPTVAGSYDRSYGGKSFYGFGDAFAVKLAATGNQLLYSTYLGGAEDDSAQAVAVDGAGAAYVTGLTTSSSFPTTVGAYDRSFGGGDDAFILKIRPNGSGLLYSTFLGGSSDEWPSALAVDAAGAAYVAGRTNSTDFPTTPGSYDTSTNDSYGDAFVSKLTPSGSGLVYSTFLGGTDLDDACGIVVDASGAANVIGYTYSSDFPTTADAINKSLRSNDAFLSKLNPQGSALLYSTLIGGGADDKALAVTADSLGILRIAGYTTSSDFPSTTGAYDTTFNGVYDAFVMKFDTRLISYLPAVMDNVYGGWNTGIGVRNPLSTSVAVQIIYRAASGAAVLTDTSTIPSNGYRGVYQGGLFGGNWAGSAEIRSVAPVVTLVNEVGPGNYAMGYTGAITSATTIYLPAVMDNAYGGWTSGIGVKNTSNLAAAVTIRYYRPDGVQADSESQTIQPNGYWGVYQGGRFGGGWAGSAVITSNQPVVAVVNEVHSSGSAISYNGFPAGGNLVNLPAVLNDAYGGWTTGVSIQNTSTSPASGTITYFNANGTQAGQQSISLPGRGYAGFYQGTAGLPDGWAGSAIISSTTAVVAIVNEVPTSGDAMGYGGVVTGETEVNLPAVMDNAYGGWTTGLGIQNTANGSVGVTVTYYDTGGTQIGSPIGKTIPARGYWGLYQGGTLGGGAGSAKIVASGPVAAIVNEIGPGGSAISYNGTP